MGIPFREPMAKMTERLQICSKYLKRMEDTKIYINTEDG
jgi:hypothetical protein